MRKEELVGYCSNIYTRCTSSVSVALQCQLVSGWGQRNRYQCCPVGLKAWERLMFHIVLCVYVLQSVEISRLGDDGEW